ncbi:MAG: ArsR family transcriptional regulator [Candidatus Omnitrophica bacterium]|nr:ArsR family transcriptional regulator [Candidatus Omnitrophota bacterium]
MTELSPVTKNFVLHWGELGARWGISRTMAQIHALLYISTKPLCHEEIAEYLNVARSNVSTSIRELKSWGIVRVVHVMEDRRDHYEAIKDGWEMIRIILGERMHREVQPTIEILQKCVDEAEATNEEEEVRERFESLLDCVQTLNTAYEQIREIPTGVLVKLVKLGGKIPVKLGLFSKGSA